MITEAYSRTTSTGPGRLPGGARPGRPPGGTGPGLQQDDRVLVLVEHSPIISSPPAESCSRLWLPSLSMSGTTSLDKKTSPKCQRIFQVRRWWLTATHLCCHGNAQNWLHTVKFPPFSHRNKLHTAVHLDVNKRSNVCP